MFNCIYTPPAHIGLGYIHIRADDIGVTGVDFCDSDDLPEHLNDTVEQCRRELDEYFNLQRTTFTVPLHLIGSPFQLKVWQILTQIPYGASWSYKDQALALGSVNYTRAVGHANSKNPVCIIVPCHRVIGANQKLTGYAGGLHRKKALLTLENCPFKE